MVYFMIRCEFVHEFDSEIDRRSDR